MKITQKNLLMLGLGSALLVTLPLSASADVDKLVKQCAECHGKDGNSTVDKVPTIAGFSSSSIEDTLIQYTDGSRKGGKYKPENGDETDMNAVAKKLSEQDIKDLSEYFAGKQFKPHQQDFDAKLVKAGAKVHKKRCKKCHSDGGSNADDDASILAGQWTVYLEAELKAIKAGDHPVPKKMKKKLKKLKAGQDKELLAYYASQQ